jgi:methionine synthase II (cobalamin-independent)
MNVSAAHDNLKGLATGVGSLPHKDAAAALDMVFRYSGTIPFWPQLPKRDIREGMIAQFSEHLPCLKLASEGLVFSSEQKEKELEAFYEKIIAGDVDYFKISREYAQGLYAFYERLQKIDLAAVEFIKCHIVGPFTMAGAVNDEKGVSLLYDSVFAQAIIKGLSMKARWQLELFRRFGKKMIIFLDEPFLGCFGSAYTPINREDVIQGLRELTGDIKSPDVLIGVHCCGNTDWSIFTDIETIDIINFDAFAFLDRLILYAADLKRFLQRGGILCWGIVPTQEFTGKEEAATLVKKIEAGIVALEKKGLERELILKDLIIAPSCGAGNLDIRRAAGIFELLSLTASALRAL